MARVMFAATLAATLSAFAAAPLMANEIYGSDAKTIVTAMQAQGFRAQLSTDDDGAPLISSSVAGINFAVNFYGCEVPEGCQWIELAASFTTQTPTTMDMVNDWNANNLFGTSFIGTDGSVYLTYVLTTTGGLTRDNFNDVLARWEFAVGDFLRHINF
jgi:hypothetical protein